MERIVVNNVSKHFKIRSNRKKTVLERLTTFSDIGNKRIITVLKNISLTVREGEMVGIVGSNGSGKSTLLRIISKIIEPNKGEVRTNGKITSMNLYTGIKERMTMRDNIFLNCSLFGIKNKQIKKMYQSIVKFAELEAFTHTKLYQFSDGMKARIAFSMAIHTNPDIFLIDEVFAVGDERYRLKCWDTLKRLQERGSSILIVLHEVSVMKEQFPRTIWLESGLVKMDGDGKKVINKYLEYQHASN